MVEGRANSPVLTKIKCGWAVHGQLLYADRNRVDSHTVLHIRETLKFCRIIYMHIAYIHGHKQPLLINLLPDLNMTLSSLGFMKLQDYDGCTSHVVMLLLGTSSMCAHPPFSALFFRLHCADELLCFLAFIYVLSIIIILK